MATKRKIAKIAKPVENSTKLPNSTRIDESRTAVSVPERLSSKASKPIETIEISSDSESNYDDLSDLEGEAARDEAAPNPNSDGQAQANPTSNGDDTEMKDADQEYGDDNAEPTFGDLIRNQETVDVAAALGSQQANDASTALTALPQRQIAPTATSLGTVLAQALRTDDTDLLESCLHTSDTTVIRNTIQRLDSSLAGTLLTKLAARLHRRPGRAHNLMSFVQWTLIAHGGALATQPDIQKRLAELNRVLEERSRGLNSLLALKGKLDMLEAQMTLRRGNKSRRHDKGDSDSESDDDEDVEGIVYVEGQEDEPVTNGVSRRRDEDDDDELPIANGVASDSEEESDEEDQDELDVDEFAGESVDEDEVDHDDIEEDSAEEEDESEPEAAPPAKVQKKSKSWFSRS